LLSTLCLYRSGYDFRRLFTLSEFYDRDRGAFYGALQTVRQRDMDLTGWLEFFVMALATQLDEVRARGERVIRADLIAAEHGLNRRQARAVELLLDRGDVRIEDLEAALPEVNRRTLQRDLRGLVDRGLARAAGAARAIRYRIGISRL
jgi:Fic family protein